MKNSSISRREPLLFHFFLFLFSSFEILEESVMLARYTLSLFKYSAIRTTQFSGIMNSKRLFSVDSTVTVCHHRCSFHFMHNHECDLSLYCAFHQDDDFVSTDIGKKKAAAQRRVRRFLHVLNLYFSLQLGHWSRDYKSDFIRHLLGPRLLG